MTQITLPLDWPAANKPEDFIVSPANALAVRHLDHLSLWPVRATLLTGPRKSGRTMLGRIFAQRYGGRLIDDADRVDEEELFHAWNRAQNEGQPLLIVADVPPPGWQVALPDLRSRLAATPQVAIGDPDDALAAALIERMLGVRGIVLGRDVIDWLLARIERSYVSILRVVDLIDAAAWQGRRRITLPVVREVLRDAGLISAS